MVRKIFILAVLVSLSIVAVNQFFIWQYNKENKVVITEEMQEIFNENFKNVTIE